MTRPDHVPDDAVDITDHGAEPNPNDPNFASAVNNLQAIQDAARDAGSEGAIYVPQGTFFCAKERSQPAVLFGGPEPEGISVYGDGPGERGEDMYSSDFSGSCLAWSEHSTTNDFNQHFLQYAATVHGDVEIHHVRLDGNYENLGSLRDGNDNNGISRAIVALDGMTDSSFDLFNTYIRGWYHAGFRNRSQMDVRVDYCTFEEIGIGKHNDAAPRNRSTDQALSSRPLPGNETLVTNSMFDGVSGVMINVRRDDGVTRIHDTIIKNAGTGAFKLTSADVLEIRRCYIEPHTEWMEENVDEHVNGTNFWGWDLFHRLNSDEGTPLVDIEHLEIRNTWLTVFRSSLEMEGITGDMIAIHNHSIDEWEAAFTNRGRAGTLGEFDIGRLSIHGGNTECFNLESGTGGTIETLHHDGNSGGLGSTGGLDIENNVEGGEPFEPDVPSEDEVGILPGVKNGGDDDIEESVAVETAAATDVGETSATLTGNLAEIDGAEEATVYFEYGESGDELSESTDEQVLDSAGEFEAEVKELESDTEYEFRAVATTADSSDAGDTESFTTGEREAENPLFDEWTPRWESDEDDWSIITADGFEGGAALKFENDDSRNRARRAISWDEVGEPSDVEVLDRFRIPEIRDDRRGAYHARTYLRSGSSDDGEEGYWIQAEDEGEPTFRLGKHTAGDLITLELFGTLEEDTLFYRRFRAEGDEIKARVWKAGESEPDEWDVEVTDTDHSEGWVGLGTYDPEAVHFDTFSVATDGETAPFVSDDAPPQLSWVEPDDGETVSESVTVALEARAAGNDDDELGVEYRVDDGSWSGVEYDEESGYYETEWDSTDVSNGDYTLEARVTDREVKSSTATVSVTVDNTPDVELDVESLTTSNRTDSSAKLVGKLRDVSGTDEVDVGFEWREAGADTWKTTAGETLDSSGRFDEEVSDLESDTEYEFRATAEAHDSAESGETLTFETKRSEDDEDDDDDEEESNSLSIESFEVRDRSNEIWSRYDVDWEVADDDGDLDTVVTKLRYNGNTVKAKTTTVTGESQSYTHVVRVRGDVDEVRLVVSDTENNVQRETKEV